MSLLRKTAVLALRRLPGSRARGLGQYWHDLERIALADLTFVSFPKSGRTYIRVMLARLYQRQFDIDERDPLNFSVLRGASREVPRILFTHNGDPMRSPERIGIDRWAFRGQRVAVLARHPADVAVSRYYHLLHRSRDPVRQRLADQPIDQFVWTEQGGIPSVVQFLNQWAELSRLRDDILIQRYEDFLLDPEARLRELARFAGLAAEDAAIADAAEFARFENLKRKEQEGYFAPSRMGSRQLGNENSSKVRRGGAGGYRSQLAPDNVARVDRYLGDKLDPMFGYGGANPG